MNLSTEYLERPKKIAGLVAVKGKVQIVGAQQVLVAREHSAGLVKVALFQMTAIVLHLAIAPLFAEGKKHLLMLFSTRYAVVMMLPPDQLPTMLVIRFPSRKIHQVAVMQTLKITSGL
jgi:hypothetical protein